MELFNNLLVGATLTSGVLQLFKQTVPDRFMKYIPILSLPIGIIVGVGGFHLQWLYGIMIGLASQGLYKLVQVGSDMSLPEAPQAPQNDPQPSSDGSNSSL